MRIFGREPVAIAAVLSTVFQAVNMFWLHLTSDQTAAVNAVIAVAMMAVAAAFVSVAALLPLLTGVAQAVANLVLVLGLHVSADAVGSLVAIVSTVVAIWGVRPKVAAVVAHDGSRVPRQSVFRLAA